MGALAFFRSYRLLLVPREHRSPRPRSLVRVLRHLARHHLLNVVTHAGDRGGAGASQAQASMST
jgi:hypothetical protein